MTDITAVSADVDQRPDAQPYSAKSEIDALTAKAAWRGTGWIIAGWALAMPIAAGLTFAMMRADNPAKFATVVYASALAVIFALIVLFVISSIAERK